MSLMKSAATISAFTLCSRITGLIRDMLIARYFGVTPATDAFYVAFRIPNLLRRLFAEGAFSQAFVPMLSQVRETSAPDRTQEFIGNVFSLLALAVLTASIVGALAAPAIVWAIATGFANDPQTFTLATALTRFMFPYIFFMSLAAFAAAVLNTWKHFAVPAFTPVLLNLSFIACILLVAPYLADPIWALAIAVIGGGVLQLGMQLWEMRRLGVFPRFVNPLKSLRDNDVRQVLKLMVPALVGVSVAPVSVLINTNIASHLGDGAVTWLNYADRLMEFPTALLGVALGTVLLPSLSSSLSRGDLAHYNSLLDRGLRIMILFAAPAAVGMGLLATGLAAVLFQGKNFLPQDVFETARGIEGYAVGLIGLIAVKIIAPAFYSRKDIRTPVKTAIASVVVVQVSNFFCVPLWDQAGLALSVGIGSCFNAAVLLWILWRRQWYQPAAGWTLYLVRLIVGCAVMAAFLWWVQQGMDWTQLQERWAVRLGLCLGVIVGAALTYFAALAVTGWRARELRGLRR